MQPQIKKAILKFLKECRPGKILDIPAGEGWLVQELSSKDWEYHASDLFNSLDIPYFKLANLNHILPYDDASFDYICCFEGLEHIENYHHVLREFYRLLKPQGLLIISTPNPLNIKSRLRYLRQGTFYGFPHLLHIPQEGEHLHMNPINLSFLISFAEKYSLSLHKVHQVTIKPIMYRFLIRCWLLQGYNFLKNVSKSLEHRSKMKSLSNLNILLNDGMVVSFRK